MYEYKSDMDVVLHAIQDEIKGVDEYKWMAENCQDQELKQIALKIHADEKQHIAALWGWANKNMQK